MSEYVKTYKQQNHAGNSFPCDNQLKKYCTSKNQGRTCFGKTNHHMTTKRQNKSINENSGSICSISFHLDPYDRVPIISLTRYAILASPEKPIILRKMEGKRITSRKVNRVNYNSNVYALLEDL